MRTKLLPLSALSLLIPAVAVFAAVPAHQTYDTSYLGRYTDTAGWNQSTKVAVSALTNAGILQGDPAGTFRANDHMNRAEFVKIVMGLLPASDNREFMHCFPDVPSGSWYEAPVCRAKSMGIVRGNVDVSVDPSAWRFEPNRDVQYEEAVKVLVKLYAFPATETNGDHWYVPFINAANERGLGLQGIMPGDHLTRGEMARLTINFLAYSQGDLDVLIAAQTQSSSSSKSSSLSSSSSSRSSSTSSISSQSSSSSRVGTYDPLTDASVRSNVALLGQTSTVLAGAKFFSNNEPVIVNSIEVILDAPVSSIDALLVYDSDGFFLGTATQQGTTSVYKVSLASGVLTLPRRVDHSIYIRARLKSFENGGVSGQALKVAQVQVNGTGEWSSDSYVSSSSITDLFPEMVTARAGIVSVTNAGPATGLLTAGSSQLLATFAFRTQATDSQARVALQQIRMQIQATGGVSLSNVELRQEGNSETASCVVSSAVITCGAIPTSFGTITGTESFRVYADVTVPSGAMNPTLTLVINEPGTPTTTGDITWSDGSTTFTWMPGDAPVVRGTQFQ